MITNNKHILVITHQLSRTGAPIVLLDVIRMLKNWGYQIEVISMLEGELLTELEEMQIPVMIQEHFFQEGEAFKSKAEGYDLVIANTLITYEVIHVLNGADVPVFWWLHEGVQYFDYFQKALPEFSKLADNIHVFSVGHYVQKIIEERYDFHTYILHLMVKEPEDVKVETVTLENQNSYQGEKLKFITAGTYSMVKAQDVLVEAIGLLPRDIMECVEFHFYGNEQNYDKEIFASVEHACKRYDNVYRHAPLRREQMLSVMKEADCLVIPSRIDPIPTVAVEAMMQRIPCLCTDVCGVAHYIVDGENGFTVPPDNAVALSEKLIYIVRNISNLSRVAECGRVVYDKHFSESVITKQIQELLRQYISNDVNQQSIPSDWLSICLIAKNEERNVGRCLKYLCRLGMEIIVVDTGSSDRTKEIAQKYTSNVYDFEWCDDFSAAKNYAISKASGQFIMNVDCDEFVDEINLNELYQILEQNPQNIGRIRIKNLITQNGQEQISEEWVSRIFSKELYQFEGRIHEQLVAKDGTNYATFRAPVAVLHTGYNLSDEQRQKKSERNIELLLEEKERLEKEDVNISKEQLPYILYQLGKAYYMAHDYEEACNYFSQGLYFDLNPKLDYVIDMVETYGYAMVNAGRAQEAMFYENIYEEFGKTADFQFLMGIIYMNNELFDLAIQEFLKATEHKECRNQGGNSYVAFYNVGVIYECTGNEEKALEYFMLAEKYDYNPAKEGIERLHKKG